MRASDLSTLIRNKYCKAMNVLSFIGVVSEMAARPTFTISTLTRCVLSQGELWGHSDMHSVYVHGRDTIFKLRIHKQHFVKLFFLTIKQQFI